MWTAYKIGILACPAHSRPSFHLQPRSLFWRDTHSEVRKNQSSASRLTTFLGSRDNPTPNPFFSAQRTSLFIKINNINIHLLLTVNSLQSIHLDNVGRSKKFSYNLQPASQSKNKPKLWPQGKADPVWSSALSTAVTLRTLHCPYLKPYYPEYEIATPKTNVSSWRTRKDQSRLCSYGGLAVRLTSRWLERRTDGNHQHNQHLH